MASFPAFRRWAWRLAAATAAGCLTTTAALPAAAQTPEDPEVDLQFESLITPGGERSLGVIEIDFGPDFPSDTHTVSANLALHTDLDGFEFDLSDASEGCERGSTGVQMTCTAPDADPYTFFSFDYWANDLAVPGVYDYTLTVSVDSEPIETLDGSIEIADAHNPDPHHPYLHGEVKVTDAQPGSTVAVAPKFSQDKALSDSAAAVVVTFGDPSARVGMNLEGAEAVAGYDNCFDGRWNAPRGVTCVVTDFVDSPGGIFTLSGPIGYEIAADAPGPMAICNCFFNVYTVNASELENEYGGEFWDANSTNLLGLETADSWDGPVENEFEAHSTGYVTIVSAENPFDLAIESVNFEGEAGDEVMVTVPVTNSGPAFAPSRVDFYGSYSLRGQLPAGLELVAIDSDGSDGWTCLGRDSLEDEYGYQEDRTELQRFDFACYVDRLDSGETLDFSFSAKITDATEATDGRIEVREIYTSQYSDTLDSDLENNLAVIGVNASDQIAEGGDDASGQLPTTGLSLTVIGGVAAAALAVGAVMFVLVRRRRAGADW